jgi:hypothetical protein
MSLKSKLVHMSTPPFSHFLNLGTISLPIENGVPNIYTPFYQTTAFRISFEIKGMEPWQRHPQRSMIPRLTVCSTYLEWAIKIKIFFLMVIKKSFLESPSIVIVIWYELEALSLLTLSFSLSPYPPLSPRGAEVKSV